VTRWESYEEVATYLLDQFAVEFELERVEPKQSVMGQRSGTKWEIDAVGFRQGGVGFVLVECRRYTTSRQTQEQIAALAYRIADTGAEGGIIVSPLGLQEGAARVAAAENVVNVKLDENSSRHEYVLGFLDKVMMGVRDSFSFTESITITKYTNDAKASGIHGDDTTATGEGPSSKEDEPEK